MQKLGLSQNLQQKLSPQQIQFIKLLQVPTAELEGRIEEELEINPALEEGEEQEKPEEADNTDNVEKTDETPETPEDEYQETSSSEEEVDIKDYLADDDYSGYKMQGDGDEE
jgi:RNA polymerase sigma-54 factor